MQRPPIGLGQPLVERGDLAPAPAITDTALGDSPQGVVVAMHRQSDHNMAHMTRI
jgi:hypothetical protein